jgi:lipopolysaccharide export system permease protein
MFSTLDNYIIRQVAKPLAAAMVIGLMVLLAERLVRLLDTILGKKNSFAVVFELLAYLVPHYLGLAIPAALFLGLLLGFNRMSRDSEIDAFQASGIGLQRLVRPAALLGLVLSLASLFIFGWAQPHTRYAYRAVVFNIKNIDVFYLAEEGIFMQTQTRTFILDELNRPSNSFGRIFIFDNRDKDKNGLETITAAHGTLIERPEDPRPVLRLEQGHRLQIETWPDWTSRASPMPATTARFAVSETPLGKVSSKAFRPRGEDERELTLPELLSQLDRPPIGTTRASMVAEFHKRLISILVPLMLPFLAIPFALGNKRTRRTYRIGAALVLLVAFNEVIEQGAVATRAEGSSPWLTMWLPFLALTSFAAWRFKQACASSADIFDQWLERAANAIDALRNKLFHRMAGADA